MDIKNYKCINCGSDIVFEPSSKRWKCLSCFSEFSKEQLDEFFYNKEDGIKKTEKTANINVKLENLNSYNCQNCGGEIVADDNTVATFCPYCKSPSIIKSKLQGEFNPELVIPFRKPEKEAKELYNNWIMKKIYTPKDFKSKETIDEIKGLYAPYWLYDMNVNGRITATATRVSHWSDGEYHYTKTDYYDIYRAGNNDYEKIPQDAATKLDDVMMDHIEPFNYEEMTDFEMPYMAGFFAERYDLDSNQCLDAAKEKAETYFEKRLRETIKGYHSFSIKTKSFSYSKVESSYAMLPIYYLANFYNGKKHDFMMNGQTGKIYGNPPVSLFLVGRMFILSFIICYVIALIGGVFLNA